MTRTKSSQSSFERMTTVMGGREERLLGIHARQTRAQDLAPTQRSVVLSGQAEVRGRERVVWSELPQQCFAIQEPLG